MDKACKSNETFISGDEITSSQRSFMFSGERGSNAWELN